MLSFLVIFNDIELQENLIDQIINTVSNLNLKYVNIRTRWKKKYKFVSHQQKGDNEYMGI